VASVTVDGEELVVGLSPLERLAAFHGDVRVPLATVRSVSVEPRPWSSLRGLRAPGTGVPGLLAYGVRRMTGGRPDFVAILRGEAVVRVELDPPAPFERLLVTVSDPDRTVAVVRDALG
jgi:hypothetical protein